MLRRNSKSPDQFWSEYEEKIGEKVLAFSLAKYLSGWEEFDKQGRVDLWGLIIVSSGGFRFHHFPKRHWLDFMSSGEDPKEKSFIIPKEKLISARLLKERNWLKIIISSARPKLEIYFSDDFQKELRLVFEADLLRDDFIEKLTASISWEDCLSSQTESAD